MVISLDFELYWGVHETRALDDYRRNLLGARAAIPRVLDLFEKYGIGCTWATVGFLFFDDKEELLQSLPEELPRYTNPLLSSYRLLPGIGANEREDPCHYALSLLKSIKECPRQEIGTHTFSHHYCLDEGQTAASFRADLIAARRAAERIGVTPRSLVFPRNQYGPAHLKICREVGIEAYRGNQSSRPYRAVSSDQDSALRRVARLLDTYLPITGSGASHPSREASGLINVPASRFMRPLSQRLRPMDGLRLRRVRASMTHAARTGAAYHLWGHPHNLGGDVDASLAFFERILEHYAELRDRYGMRSQSMGEVAQDLRRAEAAAWGQKNVRIASVTV